MLSYSGSIGYEKRSLSFPIDAGYITETAALIGLVSNKNDRELIKMLNIRYPGISISDLSRMRKLLDAYQEATKTEINEDETMRALMAFLDELRARKIKESTR